MKLASSGTENYYIPRAELLRKLGIPDAPGRSGEQVDVTLTLASQDGLAVTVQRSLPEKELPEASHPRTGVTALPAMEDKWP